MIRQYIGSVRPEVRSEIISRLSVHKLVHVLDDLMLLHAPCEVGVRLGEPDLRQRCHYLRAGKCFRQENNIIMLLIHFRDGPLPERDWFCMGIINPEYFYSLIDPERDDG